MIRWFKQRVWDLDNRLACRVRWICDLADLFARDDLSLMGYILRCHSPTPARGKEMEAMLNRIMHWFWRRHRHCDICTEDLYRRSYITGTYTTGTVTSSSAPTITITYP